VSVPRLRLLSVAAAILLCALASATGSPALAATSRTHARSHRAARCTKLVRRRAHGAHSKRRVRTSCSKHHVASGKHASQSKPATKTLVRSKSADDGCPNAALQPTEYNLETVREATLCLINRERAAYGESPLHDNAQVQQAAQGHTESMVLDDYFGHLSPSGETILQRMRASGYVYSSHVVCQVAENIAWGTNWLGAPKAIVAAWMASPEHRANILDPSYRDTGIGVSPHPPASVAGGQAGGVYTQDFGVIVSG
jgi:uncharacterized protein YkwD